MGVSGIDQLVGYIFQFLGLSNTKPRRRERRSRKKIYNQGGEVSNAIKQGIGEAIEEKKTLEEGRKGIERVYTYLETESRREEEEIFDWEEDKAKRGYLG